MTMIQKLIRIFERLNHRRLAVGMAAKSLEWVNDGGTPFIRVASSVLPKVLEWAEDGENRFSRTPGCILSETLMNFLRENEKGNEQ